MSGLIVDLFAGGGGASTGIEWALGRSPDVAVDHSAEALEIHALNHPKTDHIRDDIRDVDPVKATGGRPVDLLWASPDCKHFSRAKGGRPLDDSIRTLPHEVVRWAKETRPRLIALENVPEMTTWGPLDADGYPIKALAGTTFSEWEKDFHRLGYRTAKGLLKACDFGAPTSRKRLFFVARLDGEPVLPSPTHGPGLLPYRTAAECIDWSDLGRSIFNEDGTTRHAEATLRRIAKGVVRFVLEAAKPFVVGVGGRAGQGGVSSWPADAPLGTVTTKNDRALVVPTLIQTGYGEREGQAPRALDIRQPLGTIVAGGAKHALVSAFLAKHYTGVYGQDLRAPIGTVTAVDHHSVVAAHLIRTDMQSGGRLRGLTSLDDPLKTITTGNGHALVAAFLSTYYGQSVGQKVGDPLATITTKDRHGLVTVAIDGTTYALVDIRMRMLKAGELKLGQGFPASYRLEGTQRLQVRLIGNSVPPQLAAAVVRANTPARVVAA